MTLNLYVDGYTVTKGLSECSFTLKGPQAGVLTGGTEKQGSCSCTPALLFTGSRWCWSEALQAPCPEPCAWASCHLCSHLVCPQYFLHSQPKQRRGSVTICTCCLLQCILWCSRSLKVFAILVVILLTAWNGEWCIMTMAASSSSCRYWELMYLIGSAIFSLHPSIVCCLMPWTIYMIQLEIKFLFHVALNSHLLWDCQGSYELILCHGLSVPKTYISCCLPHS